MSKMLQSPVEATAIKSCKSARWLARQFDKSPCALDIDVAHVESEHPQSMREFLWALHLVHEVYVKRHYIQPRPSRLHLNLYLLLPQTRTFVVKEGEHIIGTLSIVLDSPFGLPVDQLYPEAMCQLRETAAAASDEQALLSEFYWDSADLAPLVKFVRTPGRRIAEVTAFALDEEYQSHTLSSASICLELMRLAYKYAIMAGVHTYVIEVTPNHAPFYEQFWGYRPFASGRVFPSDRAPAVALCSTPLDQTKAFADAERMTGGMDSLLLLKKREHELLAAAMHVPLLSPQRLRYYLQTKFHAAESSLWAQASGEERAAFKRACAPFAAGLG